MIHKNQMNINTYSNLSVHVTLRTHPFTKRWPMIMPFVHPLDSRPIAQELVRQPRGKGSLRIGERDESVCRRTQHKNECKRQMCTWASIQAARQAGWQAASIEATHTLVAAGRQRMPAHLPLLISIFGVHPYTDMRCVCMAGPRCWSSVRVNIQRRQKYSVSSHNSSFLSDSLIWCVPGFLYRYACVIFLSFPP